MKISASGQYAVRIMADIGSKTGYVSLKDVAERQGISLKYAEKIVSKLLKANLLESQRGQDGGYKLFCDAKLCTIKKILEVTCDVTAVVSCIDADCPRKGECLSVPVWTSLNEMINNFLDSVTLFDLINKNTKQKR